MSDREDSAREIAHGSSQEAPRRHDLTNVDQVSLLNSSIDSALKRQSDSFMQYIDSRFSQLPKPTVQPVDDFVFSREGNKIQFKFNTERSNKLSDILECIQSKDFEAAELIIKSELNEITQRNKIIKIADRHGWDVVKEYSIPPLADDNEDAVKLRTAINRATRRRAKPYERSNSTFTNGRGSFRRQPDTSSAKSNQPTFPAGAFFECHLPGHFAKQCPYKFRQYAPRKAPSATVFIQPDNPPNSQ